ncbi:MFS transporter [Sphaerisporangium rufum]|uniref:MFS transporter n=1 Tax=Sphaerisporangium rufum TaxID=1381558 RepID=A0A919R113_9ACTN|nr:MFS transporter [Sphaerisporangium rufum]GII76435.1 MFS transporter [Sphaerisporangium rufum]
MAQDVATAGRAALDGGPAPRPADGPGAGRNEIVLVTFTAVTNLADGVLKVALPLLAVGLTGSPGLVAGVALTLTLPWLLCSLPVGVLVDRWDRRRLAVAAGLARLVAVGGLLAAVPAGLLSLPLLYAAGLVVGVADVVGTTAVSALVPAAIPRRRRGRANAWIAGAETLAGEFCGPAVGGLLAGAGAALALGSSAGGFLLGAVLIMLLAGRFTGRAAPAADVPVPPAGSGGGGRAMLGEIKEGLVFLWRQRLLRTMALTISVLAGCWSAWLALLPSYATGVLALDPAGYGLLISAIGVGGLAGAALTSVVNRLLGVRWALFADLVGTFLMMIVPPVLPVAWAVGAAAFLGGMGGTLWTVNARTISQNLVPDHLLGRYGAASRMLSWGTLPLAAGVAGILAELAGVRAAFAVFAAAAALLVVPFLRVVTPRELAAATAIPGRDVSHPQPGTPAGT